MRVNPGVGRILHQREIQRTRNIAQDIVDKSYGVEKPNIYLLSQVYQMGRSIITLDSAKMGNPGNGKVG